MGRNEKSKNPAVPQSKRLDVSSGLQCTLELKKKKKGSNAREGMAKLARQEQAGREQRLLLLCPYRVLAEGVTQVECVSS